MKRIELIHNPRVIPHIPVDENPYIRHCSNPFDSQNGQMMFLYNNFTYPGNAFYWMVCAGSHRGYIEVGTLTHFYKINEL